MRYGSRILSVIPDDQITKEEKAAAKKVEEKKETNQTIEKEDKVVV